MVLKVLKLGSGQLDKGGGALTAQLRSEVACWSCASPHMHVGILTALF